MWFCRSGWRIDFFVEGGGGDIQTQIYEQCAIQALNVRMGRILATTCTNPAWTWASITGGNGFVGSRCFLDAALLPQRDAIYPC